MLRTEPSAAVGAMLTALLIAILGLMRLFGVNLPETLEDNVTALVTALCAIPTIAGLLIRYFVVSPKTAGTAVAQAYRTNPADAGLVRGGDVPNINVQGYQETLAKEGIPAAQIAA